MANKIDTAMDNLQTALAALVTTGVLKAVKREVLLPFTQQTVPILGLAVSRIERQGTTWEAEVLIMVVANAGGKVVDEAITELVAKIDAKIAALVAAGTAGAMLDRPMWDFWYAAHDAGGPLRHVGAIGSLKMRVEDPL